MGLFRAVDGLEVLQTSLSISSLRKKTGLAAAPLGGLSAFARPWEILEFWTPMSIFLTGLGVLTGPSVPTGI